MPLEFYRLCFRLLAQERIRFPVGKAGNVLRGAFGSMLRKQFCRPQCTGAGNCPFRNECAYASIFEPHAAGRLANRPRQFVFRADHLDGQTVNPGLPFEFEVNLFHPSPAMRDQVVHAFSELDALGAHRSPVKFLESATQLISLDLALAAAPARHVQVFFRTPTELKSRNEVAGRPEFLILYARAAERVGAFCRPPVTLPDCPDVELIDCSLTHSHVERRSSRTGQRHRLGGFTGNATYRGDLRLCLPVLKAAEFTGVGRHTSWGNGRLELRLLDE